MSITFGQYQTLENAWNVGTSMTLATSNNYTPVQYNITNAATTNSYYSFQWIDYTAYYDRMARWQAAERRHHDYRARAQINYVNVPPQTEEEIAAAAAQVEAHRVSQAEAIARALALFREHLTAEQLETFERDKVIHVLSQHGRRYRIHCRGMMEGDDIGMGNIDWLGDEGNPPRVTGIRGRLCAHPANVPAPDAWLAQKLSLECDEDAIVSVANLHYGERPPRIGACGHQQQLVEVAA